MNNEVKKRGRPHGTKKEPTKVFAKRIKISKYEELVPKLNELINQSK